MRIVPLFAALAEELLTRRQEWEPWQWLVAELEQFQGQLESLQR